MVEPTIAPDDAALLAEQVAYYRARAGEYDEWWLRTGRYDRGAALNAQWLAETDAVEAALDAFLRERTPQTIVRSIHSSQRSFGTDRWIVHRTA